MSDHDSKLSFFRQSGWMVMATVGGGAFMFAVHMIAARAMTKEDYGAFFTLMRGLIFLGIPSAGLTVIFARQAAAAVTPELKRELASTTRQVVLSIGMLWLMLAGLLLVFQGRILQTLKLQGEGTALWLTMVVVLTTLLLPIVRGILQGDHQFAGLGWTILLDGAGRFLAVGLLLYVVSRSVTAAMVGAILGQILSVAVGIGAAKHLLFGRGGPVPWKSWLKRTIPLIIGSGAMVFMMSLDSLFVRALVSEDDYNYYVPGYLVGFALTQFTLPIALVMFPRIVRSAAVARQTNALKLTLLSTAVVGGLAALASTLLPWLPVWIIVGPDYLDAAPLVPWFAWAMLLFTLANVLIGNLLGREKFRIVAWMVAIAAAYLGTLLFCYPRLAEMPPLAAMKLVILILAIANLCLLLVSAAFTWNLNRNAPKEASDPTVG